MKSYFSKLNKLAKGTLLGILKTKIERYILGVGLIYSSIQLFGRTDILSLQGIAQILMITIGLVLVSKYDF